MEFSQITGEDLSLYALQMERVRARIENAGQFLQEPHTYPRVEAGLLQLRQAMETVAVASLISNRGVVERVANVAKRRKHDDAIKLVRTLNPEFWPQPSTQVLDDDDNIIRLEPVAEGFLTELEYLSTWGRLSEWLHARTPFASFPPPEDGVALGQEVAGKLVCLLNHHTVQLVDRQQVLACMMRSVVDDRVQVVIFERIEPPT